MSARSILILVLSSFAALVVAYSIRAYDARVAARDTCHQVEDIKRILRPDPFDKAETIAILRDIGINPGSEVGKRLLKRALKNNAEDRADLAPKDCS